MNRVLAPGAFHRPPQSTHPISLDHRLQVNLQSRSITTSKCISRLARFWPACSHDHHLQVHLQTHSIMALKCTRSIKACKLAQLCHTSASPNSLYYGLHNCTIISSKCISPNLLDHGLQVCLQTRSIAASKLAQSWPRSACPNLLEHYLVMHL
jgi:hypothetical protein